MQDKPKLPCPDCDIVPELVVDPSWSPARLALERYVERALQITQEDNFPDSRPPHHARELFSIAFLAHIVLHMEHKDYGEMKLTKLLYHYGIAAHLEKEEIELVEALLYAPRMGRAIYDKLIELGDLSPDDIEKAFVNGRYIHDEEFSRDEFEAWLDEEGHPRSKKQ